MARTFNGSSDTVIAAGGVTLTNGPYVTMSCWFNPSASGQADTRMVSFGVNANLGNYDVRAHSDNTLVAGDRGAGDAASFTINTFTINAWNHACCTYSQTANQIIPYLNGDIANSGLPHITTSSNNKTGVSIGCLSLPGSVGDVNLFAGRIAEVGLWSTNLDTNEIIALSRGYSPLCIRRDSLEAYWPLIGRTSPEVELITANGGTVTGTANYPHPRMIYPKRKANG